MAHSSIKKRNRINAKLCTQFCRKPSAVKRGAVEIMNEKRGSARWGRPRPTACRCWRETASKLGFAQPERVSVNFSLSWALSCTLQALGRDWRQCWTEIDANTYINTHANALISSSTTSSCASPIITSRRATESTTWSAAHPQESDLAGWGMSARSCRACRPHHRSAGR